MFNRHSKDDSTQRICSVAGNPLVPGTVASMMQTLPFYDDGALRTLRDFEELVYRALR